MRSTVRTLVLALGLVILPASLSAVGTVTVTTGSTRLSNEGVSRYTIEWTSDASGAVSGNTAALSQITRGYLLQVRFEPSSGGTQPSDGYDATLVDAGGFDLLDGNGSDLSNSSTDYAVWNPRMFVDGALDLVIANAGSAKKGTVTIWVQR